MWVWKNFVYRILIYVEPEDNAIIETCVVKNQNFQPLSFYWPNYQGRLILLYFFVPCLLNFPTQNVICV